MIGGHRAAVLWVAASRICSILRVLETNYQWLNSNEDWKGLPKFSQVMRFYIKNSSALCCIGNKINNSISNSERGCFFFTLLACPRKREDCSLALVQQPIKVNENTEFKTNFTPLQKINCVISSPWLRSWIISIHWNLSFSARTICLSFSFSALEQSISLLSSGVSSYFSLWNI